MRKISVSITVIIIALVSFMFVPSFSNQSCLTECMDKFRNMAAEFCPSNIQNYNEELDNYYSCKNKRINEFRSDEISAQQFCDSKYRYYVTMMNRLCPSWINQNPPRK